MRYVAKASACAVTVVIRFVCSRAAVGDHCDGCDPLLIRSLGGVSGFREL